MGVGKTSHSLGIYNFYVVIERIQADEIVLTKHLAGCTERLGLVGVGILIAAWLKKSFLFLFLYSFKSLHADCGCYNYYGKDPSWKLKHTQRRKLNSTLGDPAKHFPQTILY